MQDKRMGIWHLANFLTFGNALSGLFALFFAAKGDLELAVRLIALGMLFDSLDGPIARWRGPTSEGKTLDRISDRITMAMAPTVVLAVWANFHPASLVLGALIVLVSLVRLVRTDASGSDIVGLPFWAPGILIVGGIIANIPFWWLWGIVFFVTVLSLSRISFSFPWAIRKPNPASGGKQHFLLAAVRALPFAFLLFATEPIYAITGWIVFGGCVALLIFGLSYIIWTNTTKKHHEGAS